MYSHGSLRSELVDILTFVDESFNQIPGPSREHGFKAANLPTATDEVWLTSKPFLCNARITLINLSETMQVEVSETLWNRHFWK